jgi:hypothetical protein
MASHRRKQQQKEGGEGAMETPQPSAGSSEVH